MIALLTVRPRSTLACKSTLGPSGLNTIQEVFNGRTKSN
jgi:hypothetical protein